MPSYIHHFEENKVILNEEGDEDSTLIEVGLAGGIAGLFNTIVVTPIELVKCKMQMQKKIRKNKTSMECFFKLILKNGVIECTTRFYTEEVGGNAL